MHEHDENCGHDPMIDILAKLGSEEFVAKRRAQLLRKREVAISRMAARTGEGDPPPMIWVARIQGANGLFCGEIRFREQVARDKLMCYQCVDVREPVEREGKLAAVKVMDRFFSAGAQLEFAPIHRPAWFDNVVDPIEETEEERNMLGEA